MEERGAMVSKGEERPEQTSARSVANRISAFCSSPVDSAIVLRVWKKPPADKTLPQLCSSPRQKGNGRGGIFVPAACVPLEGLAVTLGKQQLHGGLKKNGADLSYGTGGKPKI